MRKALVCGAGGFIGSHLVAKLEREGFWTKGIDLKYPEFSPTKADEFVLGDLRDPIFCSETINQPFVEVYQLAADMGGAGYLFTGVNDAEVMHNSALINLNVLKACQKARVKKIFYASSACVYPKYNQADPDNPKTVEDTVYPADPDSEYGWEKLFSERLYLTFKRNYKLDCRIARLHNIFGPEGTWCGGREKVPAAVCRKVAQAAPDGEIELWGDGRQTRSFLFIDECLNGVRRFMDAQFAGPINIGSAERVTINELVRIVMEIAGKDLVIKHTPGPVGVRGRTSNNTLIKKKLGWAPDYPLRKGLVITYRWIDDQLNIVRTPGTLTHTDNANLSR